MNNNKVSKHLKDADINIDKLKSNFQNRKSERPMGTIYPQRIKRILEGQSDIKKFGGYNNIDVFSYIPTDEKFINPNDKQEYIIYTKADKKFIKTGTNTYVNIKIFDKNYGAMPYFCPVCNRIMKSAADKKLYNIKGKCLKCVVEEESKYRAAGVWKEYENNILFKNQLSYLSDIKDEMDYYINGGLKKQLEFHKEDGKVEKWTNEGYESSIKFMKKELKEIRKYIKILKEEINKTDIILSTI